MTSYSLGHSVCSSIMFICFGATSKTKDVKDVLLILCSRITSGRSQGGHIGSHDINPSFIHARQAHLPAVLFCCTYFDKIANALFLKQCCKYIERISFERIIVSIMIWIRRTSLSDSTWVYHALWSSAQYVRRPDLAQSPPHTSLVYLNHLPDVWYF